MGLFGVGWLGENADKLKLIRSMTKDENQIKLLDEVIADFEKQIKEK